MHLTFSRRKSGTRRSWLNPITERRLRNFRANKRGYWSLVIFVPIFFLSLFAELIANDRPLVIWYDGGLYVPVLVSYSETTFGGFLETGK